MHEGRLEADFLRLPVGKAVTNHEESDDFVRELNGDLKKSLPDESGTTKRIIPVL